MDYRGQAVLITGASSGIGAVFAREFAQRGANLVLVARSEDRLQALAKQLVADSKVRVEVIAADLGKESAGTSVAEEAIRRMGKIDVLVNNAGFGTHGSFEEVSGVRQHEEVMLNVAAVVNLTHACLPGMVARGNGAIVNVASTAAFQPVPYMAVYGATKAFVLSFSEALWAENRSRGIRVLALCPGATETDFFKVVGNDGAAFGRKETPEKVVTGAFAALERGRSYWISGVKNYLLAQSGRLAPRSTVTRMAARIMRGNATAALPAGSESATRLQP